MLRRPPAALRRSAAAQQQIEQYGMLASVQGRWLGCLSLTGRREAGLRSQQAQRHRCTVAQLLQNKAAARPTSMLVQRTPPDALNLHGLLAAIRLFALAAKAPAAALLRSTEQQVCVLNHRLRARLRQQGVQTGASICSFRCLYKCATRQHRGSNWACQTTCVALACRTACLSCSAAAACWPQLLIKVARDGGRQESRAAACTAPGCLQGGGWRAGGRASLRYAGGAAVEPRCGALVACWPDSYVTASAHAMDTPAYALRCGSAGAGSAGSGGREGALGAAAGSR